MKILHLNTFDVGGAAVAAKRLHNGLLCEGVESSFLSLYSSNIELEKLNSYNSFLKDNLIEKISSSLKYRVQNILYKKVEEFNYPFSPYNVHEHPLVKEADIIHLHWVSRFVDVSSFVAAMKKVKKKIVWTLHDLNPITGGYHYLGSENIQERLYNTYFQNQQRILKSYDGVHMVSPSSWIYNLIIESGLVDKENAHLIKNGIDLQQFVPLNKSDAKSKLNLNTKKKIILFLASDIGDKRKGLIYFLKSLSYIREKKDVQFLCVGSGRFEVPSELDFLFMGNIAKVNDLVLIYSASDVYVVPSIEDNLPNTIIESLACGTPVVAFNTGGIPDLVINNYNGSLAKKYDEKDLGERINSLLRNPKVLKEFSQNARVFAEKNFGIENQSRRYIELYRSILHKNIVE